MMEAKKGFRRLRSYRSLSLLAACQRGACHRANRQAKAAAVAVKRKAA
jgi:hypothetical protein